MKLIFPSNTGKYYDTLMKYIYNVFYLAGAEIEVKDLPIINTTSFYCYINGIRVIFDISDFQEINYNFDNTPVFKRTYINKQEGVYPMGPILCKNNNYLRDIQDLMSFRDKTHTSINNYYYNQKSYGNAIEKRLNLAKALHSRYVSLPQTEYWQQACTYKYNIFLPGANEYVLDRAPSELMFIGKTIVHPKINVYFPNFKKLIADVHYIEIDKKGENVLNKLNGDTSQEAKEFFSCIIPNNLVTYWVSVL